MYSSRVSDTVPYDKWLCQSRVTIHLEPALHASCYLLLTDVLVIVAHNMKMRWYIPYYTRNQTMTIDLIQWWRLCAVKLMQECSYSVTLLSSIVTIDTTIAATESLILIFLRNSPRPREYSKLFYTSHWWLTDIHVNHTYSLLLVVLSVSLQSCASWNKPSRGCVHGKSRNKASHHETYIR